MKKIIYLMLIILLAACSQTPSYKITGDITGQEGTIYLTHKTDGKWIKADSTELAEGKFIFKGSVNDPEEYTLTFKNNKRARIPFIIENSVINIIANLNDLASPEIEITGSASQDIMNKYGDEWTVFLKKHSKVLADRRLARKDKDKKKIAESFVAGDKIFEEIFVVSIDFIRNNNKSYAAVLIASRLIRRIQKADKIDELVALMDTSFLENDLVVAMKEKALALRKVAIGQIAPDFTMNDTEGNPVKLSSLLGKGYLLIDFWASWCGPCRRENPHIVAAYNKYHKKGFEVLGVSYDTDKEKWLKAIEKDQLPWLHVSDLKGWKNLTAKLYSIPSIPDNVLLDKEGKIIAKNLNGEALKEILAELMD